MLNLKKLYQAYPQTTPMEQADSIAYCLNPHCLSQPQPLMAFNCQRCGMNLKRQGYQAIALLGQNQFSRTLLAVQEARKCVIHQRWDGRKITVELPLRSLSDLPQIPALIDCFEQDGVCYLVQEYIQGESLDKAFSSQFTATEVWRVLENLLPVLQQIHAHNLIHGDIKPENIIQTDSSQLVLVDFGAAILKTEQPHSSSPEYAAPEQIQGKAFPASDLYSLGVVCIHLLTRIAPFQLFDAMANQWVWKDYWLHSATTDSTALALILDRLIAPNLNDRFTTAAEAIVQVEQWRGRKVPPPQTLPSKHSTATLSGHEGLFASVTAVAIAPNNQHIASASEDKTVRLWTMNQEQAVLKGHTQFVQSIAFHPHQSELLLSAGRDRQIKLWNWTTQQEIISVPAHSQSINSVAFSPDGQQFASGSTDKTVKLWSISGGLIATFAEHRLAVNAVAFAPSAPLIASASSDATVRIWQTSPAKRVRLLTGHLQAVRAIAFSPDGQILASGGEDKTIRLWEVASGQCVRVLPGHSWSISALVFASNQTLISGSWDKTMRVWQVETGEAISQFVGHTDSITSVAISNPQTESADLLKKTSTLRLLVSGSRDCTVKTWQMML